MKKRYILPLVFILITCLSGCLVSVNKLKDNPQKYNEKVIYLQGNVNKSINIPFTDIVILDFQDSTGSLLVISNKEYEPGEKVFLKVQITAFPENSSNEQAQQAVMNFSHVLVENKIAEQENADEIAESVIRFVRSVTSKLNHLFMAVEEV